jgi:predicted RNase H-like HicB family nuclease
MQYIGLIHKDASSEYGVSFPDFPGCVTAGATLEEARIMAQEALSLHIDGLMEDGETLPAASSLDEILADPDNAGSIAVLAIAPARSSKVVRVNITMPEDTLAKIDAFAREHGLTRSGLLTRAAQRVMEEA